MSVWTLRVRAYSVHPGFPAGRRLVRCQSARALRRVTTAKCSPSMAILSNTRSMPSVSRFEVNDLVLCLTSIGWSGAR
jgi:hypothetical protein